MAGFRGALVGCGYYSRFHIEGWRQLEGASLVSVCDLDADRAHRTAAEIGDVTAYADLDEMLDQQRPDFVDVATTMHSHKSIVSAAARRGIPVLLQKPIAPNWTDAVELVEAAAMGDALLMVHENFRFKPAMRRARALIAAGDIGDVTWMRVSFRSDADHYGKQPYLRSQENLILLEVGVHLTDLARCFGGEIDSVVGMEQRIGLDVRGEDQVTLIARHAGSAVSLIDMSFVSHAPRASYFGLEVEIEGRSGGLAIMADGSMSVRSDLHGQAWAVREGMPAHSDSGLTAVFRHFLECLESGEEPETSGRDNLQSFAAVLAGYEALASGCTAYPRRLGSA
jgi:predicted dehydrogenase